MADKKVIHDDVSSVDASKAIKHTAEADVSDNVRLLQEGLARGIIQAAQGLGVLLLCHIT